jgi:hypothetical protein
VDPGDESEAVAYYKDVDDELGAPFGKFNQIPAFFGYPGLTGKDLEDLEPGTLMDSDELLRAVKNPEFQEAVKAVPLLEGDILASRFFAPKITDVATRQDQIHFGWRKVVRLRARSMSQAQQKGLSTAWLLFNVFSNEAKPFETKSKNNQAMLIRAKGSSLSKPVYWLVFGSVANADGDGDRINFLTASFDNRDPEIVPEGKYYVPRACADCHGGLREPDYAKAKLNYLDTDHWFDRTRDDFQTIQPGLGVVFDGGTDTQTEQFKRAFAIIYQLNQEIRDQNADLGDLSAFQLRAVEKWLDLHKSNSDFVDIFDRNLAPAEGRQWSKQNSVDSQLLPLLNRYCFRCHSSLRYHIFDKNMVFARKGLMVRRLELPAENKFAMPQDRDLVSLGQNDPMLLRDRNCMIQLLPLVGQEAADPCPQ